MAFEQSLFSRVFTTSAGPRKEAPRSVVSYERELEERRGTEIRLREELAREEALLRQKDQFIHAREVLSMEADHRLLNGLQMIVSLLSLQSRTMPSSDAAEHLSAAANRVATLARVHRRLHALDGSPWHSSGSFRNYAANPGRYWRRMTAASRPSSSRAPMRACRPGPPCRSA